MPCGYPLYRELPAHDVRSDDLLQPRLWASSLPQRSYQVQDAYLEICRCYKAIAAMPSVAEDAGRAADVLRKICWFVVLAPTSSDQACSRAIC